MPILKKSLLLLAAIVLTGCWESTSPILYDGNSDAVGFEGTYKIYDQTSDGLVRATLTKESENQYTLIRDQADGQRSPDMYRMRFKRLTRTGWYVAQAVDLIDTSAPPRYRMIQIDDNGVILEYAPNCVTKFTDISGIHSPDSGDTCLIATEKALLEAGNRFAYTWEEDSPMGNLSKAYESE
jgi:hypothetical protein